MSNIEIDTKVVQMIEFLVQGAEKKNAKTHEKKDSEMVDELVQIIKKEVDRIYGGDNK